MAPDAKTAHHALKRTHLYGRHLVLEASREVKHKAARVDELVFRSCFFFFGGGEGKL